MTLITDLGSWIRERPIAPEAPRTRPGGVARRWGTVLVAALVLLNMGVHSATAADETSLGRRYDDGLDTRLSAVRLRDAAATLGYAAGASTVGRSANDAWSDGLRSAVFGLFGHANGGLFQLDELPNEPQDPWLIAGRAADVLPPSANTRAFSEYLPYVDVDDMRLLILAGCYTANRGVNGDFKAVAEAKGIDSVVAFPSLIYYPSTSPGAALSTTNYAGNYFWDRFSYHATTGADVRTALSRARTDLVTKEGTAHGWDLFVLAGAAADPGAVRLSPAGSGQLFNSDPTVMPTMTATSRYSSLSELTVLHTQDIEVPGGDAVTSVTTAEGVAYRRTADGALVDVTGIASRAGDLTVTAEQARTIAADFIAHHTGTDVGDWSLTTDRAGHRDGEALAALTWRPLTTDGVPGPARMDVEVDLRTGAVVYFAATAPLTAAERSRPTISRAAALEAAAGVVDTATATVDATLAAWDRPYWLITVDHGIRNLVPDVQQVRVDALTGEVTSKTST